MKPRIGLVCQRVNHVPFVFEAAARRGLELIAVHTPDESAPLHMPGVVEALSLPVFDEPQCAIDGLKRWARSHRLDGLVTQREEAIPWTALATQALGLPGLSPEAAYGARDKARMRELLRAAGCNVPRFVKLAAAAQLAHCSSLRFPVVVKPTSGLGSTGVTLARNEAELRDAVAKVNAINEETLARYARWADGHFAAVVVEEFIDGPEYVAECFSRDGQPHVLAVGYKGNPRGPYFEETVYLSPPDLPAQVMTAIADEARRGMRALGLADGPGHCEMRLGADGKPYILELGARIGGSGISHFIVESSTGIDFAGLQYDFALDRPATPLPDAPHAQAAASNWIIPLGGSGTLVDIEGLDEVARHPDFRRLLRFAALGARMRPYPHFDGFLGFILGMHRDAAAGQAFFDFLQRTVRVVWR